MDVARLTILLTEARASAYELRDITRPVVLSPGHLHSLAQCLIELTTACEGLQQWGLRWMVAAARRPPGDVH